MPLTQDSQTTFKPNLTTILVSARARYIISNPDGRPCSIIKICITSASSNSTTKVTLPQVLMSMSLQMLPSKKKNRKLQNLRKRKLTMISLKFRFRPRLGFWVLNFLSILLQKSQKKSKAEQFSKFRYLMKLIKTPILPNCQLPKRLVSSFV